MRKPSFAFAWFLFFSLTVFSQNKTMHSGNWSDPTIWSLGAIPLATDQVYIDHYVHLDMDVVFTLPGTIQVSATGELCGDHSVEGSFTNYGSINVGEMMLNSGPSCNYGVLQVLYMITVVAGGSFQNQTSGTTCVGCTFTCPVQPPVANFGKSVTICEGQSVQFHDMSTGDPKSWSWSFTGGAPPASSQQNPSATYNLAGVYDVSLIASNPLGSDTMVQVSYITVVPSPTVSVSSGIIIGYGDSAVLVASGGGPYLWSTGDTTSSVTVYPSSTTIYSVTVASANGCTDNDYVKVEVAPCPPLYLPNAFSPNGDGENDVLQLYNSNQECVEQIYFQVFDRWGKTVFESADRYFQWDGRYEEVQISPAVFSYQLHVKLFDDIQVTYRGNITLIR